MPADSLGMTNSSFGRAARTEELRHAYSRLSYGKFERKVELPNGLDADHVDAQLHHGLLDISIPVAEAVKPRRIAIQGEMKAPKKIAA